MVTPGLLSMYSVASASSPKSPQNAIEISTGSEGGFVAPVVGEESSPVSPQAPRMRVEPAMVASSRPAARCFNVIVTPLVRATDTGFRDMAVTVAVPVAPGEVGNRDPGPRGR